MRSRSRRRSRAAFTLMEVLLVLVILVVLGSFAAVTIGNVQARANQRAAQAQIGLFKTPISTFQLDTGRYPTVLEDLLVLPSNLTNPTKWSGPYLDVPQIPIDPWGNPYMYQYPGTRNPTSYDVWSIGPDLQNGTQDDLGNWLVVQ